MFNFLVLSFGLLAENANQPQTAIYIVPDNPCEYVTGGKSHFLHESEFSCITCFFQKETNKNVLEIWYESLDGHFSCSFGAREGEILAIGTYENAEVIPFPRDNPKLSIGGFGRGHSSTTGEFEVFEIQYDENDNILSFAADFKISADYQTR
jgi:hypothetical protein